MPRPKKQINPITLQDWQRFAQDQDVQERIKNDVIIHFQPPLVAHFSEIQTITWPAAVAALHCVLSWMQSKQILTKKLQSVAAFVNAGRKVRRVETW
mgnify:CR=1 FL=1